VKALIVGATSAIAQATARLLADRGAHLYLIGRDAAHLAAVRDDLRVRGASATEMEIADLDDVSRHDALVADAEARLGGLDVVLVAHGILGDPEAYRKSGAAVEQVLRTNLVSPASLLTAAACRMEVRRAGVLMALSSVAGDRGRQSNYVYGASKGGLAIFLQGLRNRLHASGVRVVTVKLGFVDTPMTAGFRKGPLFAQPETVARGIVRALERRRDVVYLPGFWRWIMLVIRAVPERLFKRMSL